MQEILPVSQASTSATNSPAAVNEPVKLKVRFPVLSLKASRPVPVPDASFALVGCTADNHYRSSLFFLHFKIFDVITCIVTV